MALLADVRRRRDRRGWLHRRADTFDRLDKIGQGYSNVYKARDLQSGKIVALKRVRFVDMDPESVRFMAWDCGRSTSSGGLTTPT